MKEVSRFVIFIPHRDALKPLEEYRSGLFAAGFPGAYSFPSAAPIALVSRPLDRQELKELAWNIRGLTAKTDGKIQSAGTVPAARKLTGRLPDTSPWLMGIPLELPVEEALFPRSAREKLLDVFSPPALCAALVYPGEENRAAAEGPPLSFRAACLANIAIRPLPGGDLRYSFEWKIGPPLWLPKYPRPGGLP